MSTGDIIAHQVQSDGSTRPIIINGTGVGSVPLVPLPMSVIPVVKSRIDVHPFAITVGPTARRSGHFDLTVPAGMNAFFNVIAYQSAIPGANKGTRSDAREFDQIFVAMAILNDTTLRGEWVATGPVLGNFNFYYQIKN